MSASVMPFDTPGATTLPVGYTAGATTSFVGDINRDGIPDRVDVTLGQPTPVALPFRMPTQNTLLPMMPAPAACCPQPACPQPVYPQPIVRERITYKDRVVVKERPQTKVVEKVVPRAFANNRVVKERVEVPRPFVQHKALDQRVPQIVDRPVCVQNDRLYKQTVSKVLEKPVERVFTNTVVEERAVAKVQDVQIPEPVVKENEVPVTLTKEEVKYEDVPVEVAVPKLELKIEKYKVPYDVIKKVEVMKVVERVVEVEKGVAEPMEVTKTIVKPVPYEQIKYVYRDVEQVEERRVPYYVTKVVEKRVPYPVERIHTQQVSVPMPYNVTKTNVVEKKCEIPYPVTQVVEKKVPYDKIVNVPYEKQIVRQVRQPYYVEKRVPQVVTRVQEKRVPYEVTKVVEKRVPQYVQKVYERRIPQPVCMQPAPRPSCPTCPPGTAPVGYTAGATTSFVGDINRDGIPDRVDVTLGQPAYYTTMGQPLVQRYRSY